MSSLDTIWLKKIRFLYQILIISLALNAALILTIAYNRVNKTIKKANVPKIFKVQQASKLAVIEACFDLSYNDLIDLLSSKEHIEDGLCYRDIALACLISFHDFAIERVFFQNAIEKRELVICKPSTQEKVKMDLILGLDDQAFSTIENFARKERFAVTLRGLFFLMQSENKHPEYECLAQQIYIQEPFCALYSLLNRVYPQFKKTTLLDLILSADFELFKAFYLKAFETQISERQECLVFLKKYLLKGSKIASQILMAIDTDYCVHQLDQIEMLQFIDLLDKPTFETVIILKRLLCSLRSSKIHEAAAKKLYEFAGEKIHGEYDHKKALNKFLPTFYSRNVNVIPKKT